MDYTLFKRSAKAFILTNKNRHYLRWGGFGSGKVINDK